MKKIIFPILALILAACISSSEGTSAPQATHSSPAMGEGTGVRETPLPTLTPTPVAVDGIAEDAEGDKSAYLNGEWTALPPLDGEFAKMLQQPDGTVVAVGADGEIAYEYDMATGSWVDVEKSINSCVDPKAIERQDADFEARTGVDLDNPDANPQSRAFADALNSNSTFSYDTSKGVIIFSVVKTGMELVDMSEMTDGRIDKVMCIYGRSSAVPDKTVSIVVGWFDNQNVFHPFDVGANMTVSPERGFMPNVQLDFFEHVEDGAVLRFTVHTFSGLNSVDEIKSISDSNAHTVDNTVVVQDFIRALDNQMVERAGDELSADAHWALQDPARGDVGFIPAGPWKYVEQVDLK